ncbi:MAG: MFS transporter [Actinobacteria bacterium]|nr:MFS transporter [Actinomycetota bacterium]
METGRPHHNLTLGILTFAGTAFALQQTMVFPALTTFQRELGASTAWTTWVLTAFLVSAAVTTPIFGRLGDQYGKERMLLVTLSLFLAGSIGAAAAWDIWSLIGFRALSGAGGALFPLSFAIIRDELPPERVKVGFGLLSAVFGVGGGFGIVLSGVIVDHFSWRWLFILGSIAVALSIVLVHRFVPESPVRSPSRVDVPGALLLSAALVTLMISLTEGEHWGWTSSSVLGLAAASGGLFAAWGLVEARSASPMVDMRMLAHRPVLLTNVTTMISGFALFSCFVLVPAFVQAPTSRGYGFGASATEAGLFLLPSSVAMLFSGPAAGVIGRRFGSKWPLAGGMLIVTFAALLLAEAHDEAWHVVVASGALGAGVGLAFAAMVALISENVRQIEMGVATGMNTVVRMIGAVVGGQLGAALLTAQTIGETSSPSESAFTTAFWLSAVAALAASLIALSIGTRAPRGQREAADVGLSRLAEP